ncbi:MAG: LD-carboxypeptidase [Bacteroidetes bacterium]|nr:LD-carboxypeptidase [Bacteroidota bacterium]
MKRRGFLQGLIGAAALPAVVGRLVGADRAEVRPGQSLLLPKGLAKGSTIGVVAPASSVSSADMREFAATCSQFGWNVKFGPNVTKRNGYLSAPDAERAREFMTFIEDPSVDGIICARGGYGVMRILPMLDFSVIRDARKTIMGFSDITALLIAAYQLGGLVTFHGPVASSTFDEFTVASMMDCIATPTNEPRRGGTTFKDDRLTVLGSGVARGRLVGGNLAMIASTLGTRYEIDTTGAILFLEEISEEPYRVDRLLTQLWLAGKLQACAGIALGNFRDCESKGLSFSEPSFTLQQVLEERISSLGIPAVYGLPFGHVKSKLTLPLGVEAELDATSRTFRLVQPSVSKV